MFSLASKVILQNILDNSGQKFPLIQDVESLKNRLSQLIFRHISECVLADFDEYKEQTSFPDLSAEQAYIDFVIKSENYPSRLFTQFPVLQAIVEALVTNYVSYANEICDTYLSERDNISSIWGQDMGEVKDITIGRGDTHAGKSVAILSLTNGKIVYKPHPLDSDIFFYDLVSTISNKMNTEMLFPKILSFNSHSWQEYITYAECKNSEEAARFFYRSGIYQWVFYMLASVDMHYENLICSGEYPVFIDLETLIVGSVTALEYCEARSLQSSILMTGMLPGLKGVQNAIDMNMSALFTGRSESKKHFVTAIQKGNDDQWQTVKIPAVTIPSHNVAKIAGRDVGPHEFEKEFINGFRDAAAIYLGNKDELLKILDKLEKDSIRMRKILRPTIVYGKFIAASMHPQNLRSFEKYSSIFEIMRKNFTIGAFGYLRVDYEISELKKGNIPAFEIYSNARDLFTNHTVLCRDYLNETPYAFVKKRCSEINMALVEYQIRLIKMALVSQDKSSDLIYSICRGRTDTMPESFVHHCAEQLAASLISAPGGGYSMIALHTDADSESFVIHSADSELYHFGGIIWFLYIYGRKYNSSFIEYANGLLSLLLSKYEFDTTKSDKKNYSVYSGYGAIAYIAYNIFLDSGNEQMKDACFKIIGDGLEYIIENGLCYDFVGGDLSFVYMACNIIARHLDLRTLHYNAVERIKDLMIRDHVNLLSGGIAHGSAGLLIAFNAINLVTKDSDSIVFDLAKKVRHTLAKCEKNSWCNGKLGIILSLVKSGTPVTELDFPELTVDYVLARENLCLCHGLCGELDIILSLLPSQRSAVRDSLKMLDFSTLQIFRESNYFYESFMLGNTGIAYTIMRSEQPTLPSLLALDFFDKPEQ